MKAALWIPPTNNLIGFRLALYSLMGLVACRETYDYLNDRSDYIFSLYSQIPYSQGNSLIYRLMKFLWQRIVYFDSFFKFELTITIRLKKPRDFDKKQ